MIEPTGETAGSLKQIKATNSMKQTTASRFSSNARTYRQVGYGRRFITKHHHSPTESHLVHSTITMHVDLSKKKRNGTCPTSCNKTQSQHTKLKQHQSCPRWCHRNPRRIRPWKRRSISARLARYTSIAWHWMISLEWYYGNIIYIILYISANV